MPFPSATLGSEPPEAARIAVLLPLPLAGAYDYRLDPALDARPGDFVLAPLGPNHFVGVVWGEASSEVPDAKLKTVSERLDCPPLTDELRRFVDWVAAYTLSPPGAVLRMCMSSSAALEPPPPRIAYALLGAPPERMTAARQRVLDVLRSGPPRSIADLAEAAAVGPGVVRGLIDAGTLAMVALPPAPPYPLPDHARPGPQLSPDQRAAADRLGEAARAQAFSVTLLEGVTGAGKTEVYFEAIAAALAEGRQVQIGRAHV